MHCADMEVTPIFNSLRTVPFSKYKLWNIKKIKSISKWNFGISTKLSRVFILGWDVDYKVLPLLSIMVKIS